jgi:hypothetical protein
MVQLKGDLVGASTPGHGPQQLSVPLWHIQYNVANQYYSSAIVAAENEVINFKKKHKL